MSERSDFIDEAIDRAARQLVEHDPPEPMHAAVMSEIRALDGRRAPWPRWWLIAAPIAAALILAIAWRGAREESWHGPREDAPSISTPGSAVAAEARSPSRVDAPLPQLAAAGRPRSEPAIAVPSTPSEQAALVPAIEVGQMRVDPVRVEAIGGDPVAVPPIRIADIEIDSREEERHGS